MDTRAEPIAAFLREFKEVVVTGRGLDLIPRAENQETIVDLGMNERSVRAEILGLTVDDYCSGPEPDSSRAGEVWMFGREIDGCDVYIKLKIARVGATRIAKCISFHKAEYPLHYPLRQQP